MRRRVLLGDGMAKTVLLRNFNAASGQTFTKSTGFIAQADSVLTLFMDFTFTGNQGDGSTSTTNNILCVGIAPQEWNDTCCRLYTGNRVTRQVLVVGFDDAGRRSFFASDSLIRRNKAVLRIHYNTGTCDLWLNGQQLAQSFGLSGQAVRPPAWARSASPTPRAITAFTAPTTRSASCPPHCGTNSSGR